ncbi:MAG: hypothetical protein AB7H96_02715 [Vicinamibacterales bacterium]
MPRCSKLLAIPAVAALLAAGQPLHAQQPARAPASDAAKAARTEALKAFGQRVKDYVVLKKRLQEGLPEMKTGDRSTGKVERLEDTLAARITRARAGARPGDIFGTAAPHFKAIIELDMRERGMRDAFNSMEEVPRQSPLAVNAIYPEKAALATVPPLLLVNLPRLPDGLEYRYMGRDLILRDRDANLIVDFIDEAIPLER